MFCPKCRCGYTKGITECADCHVPLVDELPLDPTVEFVDYEEVMTTSNMNEIALVKSLLDRNNIKYHAQRSQFRSLSRVPNIPIRILIQKDQVEHARVLIADLINPFKKDQSLNDSDKEPNPDIEYKEQPEDDSIEREGPKYRG
ncbi:hypothetical protein BVX98_00105, partial [bacterium F11]